MTVTNLESKSNTLARWTIAFLVAFTCFWGIGNAPFTTQAEARVAEVAKQMLVRNDYLVPRLGDDLRLKKPPLAYWLSAVASAPGAKVSERSSRIPSAIAAMLLCLLTFLLGRKFFDERTALFAVLVLAFSSRFIVHSHNTSTDMVMSLIAFASIFSFISYLETSEKKYRFLFWVLLGIGFLAKGPFAWILPLSTVIAASIFSRGEKPWRILFSPFGIIVMLLIATPWYAYIFFYEAEAIATMTNQASKHSAGKPFSLSEFLFYLKRFPKDFHIMLMYVPLLWLTHKTDNLNLQKRILLGGVGLSFLILSFGSARESHYALPLVAPVAILFARSISLGIDTTKYGQISTRILSVILVAVGVLAPIAPMFTDKLEIFGNAPYFVAPLILLSSILLWKKQTLLGLALLLSTYGILQTTWIQPANNLRGQIPNFANLLDSRTDLEIAEYDSGAGAIVQFYTNRNLKTYDNKTPKTELKQWLSQKNHALIIRRKALENIQKEIKMPLGIITHCPRKKKKSADLLLILPKVYLRQ